MDHAEHGTPLMTSQSFEQAVFTSACSQSVQGYHLVARSDGITDDMAQSLCQWSPTHDGLSEPDLSAVSVNYCLLDDEWFALSRSIYGGPEYSGRGALQIATMILVGRLPQLSAFQNNPATLAKIALSMGVLRYPGFVEGLLDPVFVPAANLPVRSFPNTDSPVLQRLLALLDNRRRVAVIGQKNPLRFAERLLQALPDDSRRQTKFSTGMKPSSMRPFDIQFFPSIDNRLRNFLSKQQIPVINHDPELQLV